MKFQLLRLHSADGRRIKLICGNAAMIITGESRNILRDICFGVNFSTTDYTWTHLGSNPDVYGEWPATDRLSHSMVNRSVKTCG